MTGFAPSSGKPRLSAIERLQQLPALFRGSEATIRFGWTAKEASQYFFLWKRREFIVPLGGHSEVYANLIVDRTPNWNRAVVMAMPSAVRVGLDVLRQAGWSTQVPVKPAVAVREGLGVYTVDPFEVSVRDDEWFATVRSAIDRRGDLPELPPAWALADMLVADGWGGCGLHPSDIDWGEIGDADRKAWDRACRALDVDLGPLEEDHQMETALVPQKLL